MGLAVGLMASSCTRPSPAPRAPAFPDLPQFIGEETDRWLVEESGPVGRDDVLPAFETSAQNYGCRTDKLGNKVSFNIQGERRSYYGVNASCYEGTIALVTLVGGSVRIGCAKPTTAGACQQLLRNIAEAR
jgi:hypothetical protein